MNIEDYNEIFAQKMQKVKQFVEGEDIKDIVGVEAVDHYKDGFANEGFTDETLEPWEDVKRRDSKSKLFGRSQSGKYSTARTTAKILTGETSELRESITYETTDKGVKITSDKEYSAIHQFGLEGKAWGKHSFKMPARPYIGKSVRMKEKIEEKIQTEIVKILK